MAMKNSGVSVSIVLHQEPHSHVIFPTVPDNKPGMVGHGHPVRLSPVILDTSNQAIDVSEVLQSSETVPEVHRVDTPIVP